MNDYERVARVIRFLDESHVEQPDLAAIAKELALSPFHAHRLFSRWAGVTPKDFLQCLTVARAKQSLREGKSVLHAAFDLGLSSPSRLHDLCVNLEAASPGELKSGGAGWRLDYGFAPTPFGKWLVARGPRGICYVAFTDSEDISGLDREWPVAAFRRDDKMASRLSREVFSESRSPGTRNGLKAYVRGTPFQIRVWRALLQVPPGALVSYGDIASAIGSPTACRAVGSAVAGNPIAFLIPCHRVIRETGVLGQYRWGQERKRSIIAWEMVQQKRRSEIYAQSKSP